MMRDEGGIEKIDIEKTDWRGSREFFESLTDELRNLDDKDESYDFTWVGKRKSIIEAGAPINKTLRPDVEASKNWDTTENLFIEGDNLDALKLLQESYLGKVKMIYIDPPYNTGKDFVYHDSFKANVEQYDEDTEYKDEDGNIQFKKNERTNGRYHSDWLSMMYPRLKLARNLLSEDGVIFISIDDNEQANLKKLCDEVFGEDNFVASVIWKKKTNGNNVGAIPPIHDYVLVYSRDSETLKMYDLPMDEKYLESRFSNPDSDPRGDWTTTDLSANHVGPHFEILNPETGDVHLPPAGRYWVFSKDEVEQRIADGRIIFGKNGSGRPIQKKFKSDMKLTLKAETLWDSVALNAEATKETATLIGAKVFDSPKPVNLLIHILKLSTSDADVVIDFFSGSGSTAHAVMQLNAEDGGNRKWIMVQLPEETDEKSEAFKAGYKTIPEISRERIRRAGDKIANEHPDAKVDCGFRALRIDDTNYKEVYKSAGEYSQATLLDAVDNVKEDRSDLDLLYGVLTATAWELNRPLETTTLDGTTVYKYDYFGEASGLVACFAPQISEAAIKQIAQLKPLTAIFRESSFPDSQAKVNLAEHFRIISPETKVKVI